VLDLLAREGLTLGAIVLTHGHVDHVSAVAEVKAKAGGQVMIHAADLELYLSAPELGRYFGLRTGTPPQPDRLLADGDTLSFGQHTLTVMHTPGHSPGGICLHLPEANLVLVGDTLFCRGIGRTDLPGGSMSTIARSIRQRLYPLEGTTRVLPGHGPETTIREERLENPFVQG
jgi:hydroxyacylglutathione hydrolase